MMRMRARHHRAFEMNWWVFTKQKELAKFDVQVTVHRDKFL